MNRLLSLRCITRLIKPFRPLLIIGTTMSVLTIVSYMYISTQEHRVQVSRAVEGQGHLTLLQTFAAQLLTWRQITPEKLTLRRQITPGKLTLSRQNNHKPGPRTSDETRRLFIRNRLLIRELQTPRMNKRRQNNTHKTPIKTKSKTTRLWKDEDSFQLFKTRISLEDKRIFTELIKAFIIMTEENRVEYFVSSGSLLGSFRHHSMIPWDDDLDFFMNSSLKEALKSAFQIPSILMLDTSKTFRWKIYSNLSYPIKGYTYRWPSLDILWFDENSTHIWDLNPLFGDSCFQKSWIFPTVLRPFWDVWLPAPRDTERVLKKEFDVDVCVSPAWNHQLENNKDIPGKTPAYRKVPCALLHGRLPFVNRRVFNNFVIIETLSIGNRTLHSVFLTKPVFKTKA